MARGGRTSTLTLSTACAAGVLLGLVLRVPAARAQGENIRTVKEAVREFNVKALGRVDVAFSPDGKTLATASAYTVRLWDPATGRELRVLTEQGMRWVNAIAFAPDGKTLATVGGDNTVRLWDPATGALVRRLPVPDIALDAVSYAPDGKTLATAARPAGGGHGKMTLWDAATGRQLRQFGGGRIWTVAIPFSPDGKLLASGGTGRIVQLWDPATGLEVRKLGEEGKPAPGAGRRPPTRLTLVLGLAFAPDGKTLAAGDNDGKITLWDVATGRKRLVLDATAPVGLGAFGVCTVAYAPDGKSLASSGGDGVVRLWEAATGRERLRLAGHKGQVWAVAFAPDGQTLASAGQDGMARLWNVVGPAVAPPDKRQAPVRGPQVP
jgi:WD40 repeat protein